MEIPLLFYDNRTKLTYIITDTTFDTQLLIKVVSLFLLAGNGILGALAGADPAARTGIRVNFIVIQCLAYTRRAFFIPDVGLVFVTEI
jgi:hypothetical protein